jgi:hypothetical protein
MYCHVADGATEGIINPSKCPNGYFCGQQTANYQVNRCPLGKYHDTSSAGSNTDATSTGLISESADPADALFIAHCSDCPETYYCPQVAMVNAAYQAFECFDGYLCPAGSSSGANEECPRDQYCERGTAIDCPSGYYSTNTGLRSADECIPCPPGKYCPNFSVGIQDCPAGFFCPGKTISIDNSFSCPSENSDCKYHECTEGHYCPSGSGVELDCPPGTFMAGR